MLEKYKVLEPIEVDNKYLLQGDELLLISEFNGGGGSYYCVPPSKIFCYSATREKVEIGSKDFNKIEKCKLD